jgi:predicted  nucleic acid-binding Zn ribbon protein
MLIVAELSFGFLNSQNPPENIEKVKNLLDALRMNGQICGHEYRIAETNRIFLAYVDIPDIDALDHQYHNTHVRNALEALAQDGIAPPLIRILDADIEERPVCSCQTSSFYILYTSHETRSPPLRCGDCFRSVPLYRFPKTYDDEYYDIICWQSDYHCCDRLQMNCRTLERAALRELGQFTSSLSKQGRDICQRVQELVGKPVYYYLYRYRARSNQKQERIRRCPSCGGTWLLETALHHRFHFKCDICLLLSNMA